MDEPRIICVRLRVAGIVQGVGFRPTVYRYATEAGVDGWVLNDPDGVEIEVAGPPRDVEAFVARLESAPPPLARVESVTVLERRGLDRRPGAGFRIVESRSAASRSTLMSADVATCDACVAEMLDPADPRYRYPFLNCTNCGPRYSIIADIPYDRPLTTMRAFPMCDRCRREYEDPLNRRFHAQPTCCPDCGPALAMLDARGRMVALGAGNAKGLQEEFPAAAADPRGVDPVMAAREQLAGGAIVAVKGLGGFHLACRADDSAVVARLRERKRRDEKPFAVMARSLEEIRTFAEVTELDERLLAGRERPIVLLRQRRPFALACNLAPGNRWVGAMLPYTPLHHLLLSAEAAAPRGRGAAPLATLVMTSGNLSDEPIARDNREALERLRGIADFFLLHNRDILVRADDSVMKSRGRRAFHLRRSRGYVPVPVDMGRAARPLLAVGGELKNTVCLTRGRHAFVGQHIGDLEDERTFGFFEETIRHLQQVLEIKPEIVVHDLHPEYLSTKFAKEMPGVERVGVQHHHAHILSCMAEHRLREPVLGVALDGTGFGPDDTLWGGEFLLVEGASYRRLARFRPLPLPGNALAIRQPWRMALACLHAAAGAEETKVLAPALFSKFPQAAQLLELLEREHTFIRSSGAGRLFDAVASLLGIRDVNTFEGQAAMELEMAAAIEASSRALAWDLSTGGQPWTLDFGPAIRELVCARNRGEAVERLAGRFHLTVAHAVADVLGRARAGTGVRLVALSGGVFQNQILSDLLEPMLEERGFAVYRHSLVPPNDGGISLGQAYYSTFR